MILIREQIGSSLLFSVTLLTSSELMQPFSSPHLLPPPTPRLSSPLLSVSSSNHHSFCNLSCHSWSGFFICERLRLEEGEGDFWPDKNGSGSCSRGAFPDFRGRAEDARKQMVKRQLKFTLGEPKWRLFEVKTRKSGGFMTY